jgi:peptidoglycan/LPS O-acetylase OafA/YrhL
VAQTPSEGSARNPLIDSLRAVAALCVFGFHISVTRPPTLELRPYAFHLGWGVTVFFLISGYVLYRPFLERRLGGRSLGISSYGIRRLLRIVPGYWVALVLVLAFGAGAVTVRADPVTYFGFAQIYGSETVLGGIGQAWTLDVEMVFYAALPVLAAGLTAFRWGSRVRMSLDLLTFVLLWAIAIAWTVLVVRTGLPLDPKLYWLPRFLGQFAVGMALAMLSVWIARGGVPPRPLRFLFEYPSLTWLLVPAGYVLASQPSTALVISDTLDTVAAAALLWPAIVGSVGKGVAGRVLAWRPLVYLGVVSYGFYLYHFAVITRANELTDSLGGPLGWVVWVSVGLAGATALAIASWRLVEQPAIRLGRRLTRREPARRGWSEMAP